MSTLTDVQWIFLVLVGLYLLESVAWIRAGVVPFAFVLRRFRDPLVYPALIGNDHGVLMLAGIGPGDALFTAHPLPLSMGDAGVCGFVAATPLQRQRVTQTETFAEWDAVKSIRQRQCSLLIDGTVLCRTSTARHADVLRRGLQRISNLESEKRPAAIDRLRGQAFAVDGVSERLALWRQSTRRLTIASTLLFVWIFPVGLARYLDVLPIPQTYPVLIAYLGVGLTLWWWSVLEAYLSHRTLYRDPIALRDSKASRFKLCVMSLLSPVVPLRARAYLARELFDFVHPLVFVLASIETREGDPEPLSDPVTAMLRHCVRDAMYPRLPEVPSQMSAATEDLLASDRQFSEQQLRRVLAQVGQDFDRLMVFEPEDDRCESYCPRCLAEYTVIEATCDNCGGRPTVTIQR